MSESWENDLVRKKDIIDWINKVIFAYHDKSYKDFHGDFKSCKEERLTLKKVADYIYCMKPAVIDEKVDDSTDD